MEELKDYLNKITVGDCIDNMSQLPEGTVDLLVTSPPYNVGIDYDTHHHHRLEVQTLQRACLGSIYL